MSLATSEISSSKSLFKLPMRVWPTNAGLKSVPFGSRVSSGSPGFGAAAGAVSAVCVDGGVSREQAAHTARMARHVAVFRSDERFWFGVMQLSGAWIVMIEGAMLQYIPVA